MNMKSTMNSLPLCPSNTYKRNVQRHSTLILPSFIGMYGGNIHNGECASCCTYTDRQPNAIGFIVRFATTHIDIKIERISFIYIRYSSSQHVDRSVSRDQQTNTVLCVWVYLIRSTYFFSHGCDTLSVHKTKRVLSLTHSMGSLLDPMGFIIESLTPNVQMVNAPTKKKTHFYLSLFYCYRKPNEFAVFSYYINEKNSSLSKER